MVLVMELMLRIKDSCEPFLVVAGRECLCSCNVVYLKSTAIMSSVFVMAMFHFCLSFGSSNVLADTFLFWTSYGSQGGIL